MPTYLRKAALVACSILTLAAAATGGRQERRGSFPLRVAGADSDRALRLEMVPERFNELLGRSAVRLEGVPLPARGSVGLDLRRIHVLRDDSIVAVDGVERRAGDSPELVTLWRGTVAGDPDSWAFLAFSPYGSRGVIRHHGELYSMGAEPGPDGDWAGSRSTLQVQSGQETAAECFACASSEIDQLFALPTPLVPPEPPAAGFSASNSPGLVYQARIAVETDYQFFQKFGDENAAETYVLTLLGAASAIYESQCETTFTLPYVGIHTNSNDPWDAQDAGGKTSDVLYEFRAAWSGGQAPVTADLYHFLSGANLGGGIAYVNVICNQYYGFSVAGNINGGLTVPVVPGPAPWDLEVVAHELGHNFSSPHTHAFCPPLDECAPPSYFGGCQSQQVCIPNGTIMSYCHLCAGGLSNIDLRFHTTVAQTIKSAVAASCLQQVQLTVLAVDRPDGILVQLDPAVATTAQEVLAIAQTGDPGSPVDWSLTLSDPAPWLSLAPTSGTVSSEVDEVTLTCDSQALATGVYSTILTVQNDAAPADAIEVPITFHVLPPPFKLGDRLTGAVSAPDDVDEASFETFPGLTAKLTIDRSGGAAAADVAVLGPTGQEVASWHVGAGKKVKKKVKLGAGGSHVVRIDGAGLAAGAFEVKTKFRLPNSAKPRTIKKLQPNAGDNFADVTVKALAGATLAIKVKPKGAVAGPLTLMLFDPSSANVDLSTYLAADGLSFSEVPLASSGAYRLRVSGFQSSTEKVKVVVTPSQPKGTDTVPID